jgi:transposase-like protein
MAAKQRDPGRERYWRDVMADWQSSGLSIRAYCLQHRLAETAFHYWRRELRQRDAKPAARPAAAAFVPVTVIPAATLAIEVRCPSGHVVTLPSADGVVLRQLFAALAPVPPC